MESYKNYVTYPFLYDKVDDLRCDFEILTDEITSQIGYLKSLISDSEIVSQLEFLGSLTYHMNPALRRKNELLEDEVQQLFDWCKSYYSEMESKFDKFVLPQGCVSASQSHIIRVKFKQLVRLMHRYKETSGKEVEQLLFDYANLSSQYFFLLALKLNDMENYQEIEFVSRSYK